MISIRLQRIGRKGQPSYRLVAANKRSKLGGTPIEDLGAYDVFSKKDTIKKERVLHWLKNGAKLSATTHNLLVSRKIIEGKKVVIKMKKSKKAVVAKIAPSA